MAWLVTLMVKKIPVDSFPSWPPRRVPPLWPRLPPPLRMSHRRPMPKRCSRVLQRRARAHRLFRPPPRTLPIRHLQHRRALPATLTRRVCRGMAASTARAAPRWRTALGASAATPRPKWSLKWRPNCAARVRPLWPRPCRPHLPLPHLHRRHPLRFLLHRLLWHLPRRVLTPLLCPLCRRRPLFPRLRHPCPRHPLRWPMVRQLLESTSQP